ncbi:MAG TPA: glycerophosphodiester phosphodiesterase [Acidimicrobiales bacterium]
MTLVLAHRGASRAERENTLVAFARAVEMGAGGVELDVRHTADGALAVHHDAHLPDGTELCAVAASELPDYVPLLDAAIRACGPLLVNVEIKNDEREPGFEADRRLADDVVTLVRSMGAADQILVSSFDLVTVDRVRALDPDIATAWLVVDGQAPGTLATLVEHGHRILHPGQWTLTAELVQRCHGNGVQVNTWTVDHPARIAELADWGVDGICTNVPDVALEVLAR